MAISYCIPGDTPVIIPSEKRVDKVKEENIKHELNEKNSYLFLLFTIWLHKEEEEAIKPFKQEGGRIKAPASEEF